MDIEHGLFGWRRVVFTPEERHDGWPRRVGVRRAPEALAQMQREAGRILAGNEEDFFVHNGRYPDPNQDTSPFDARAARVIMTCRELSIVLARLENPE